MVLAFSGLFTATIAKADKLSKPSFIYAKIDENDVRDFVDDGFTECLTYDRISLSVRLRVPTDKLNSVLDRKDKTKIPTNPEKLAIWSILKENEREVSVWPYRTDFPCPGLQNGHKLSGDELCRFYRDNKHATAIQYNGTTYCKEGSDAGSAGLLPRYACLKYGKEKLGLDSNNVSAFVRYIVNSHQLTCFYMKIEEIELLFQRQLDWIEEIVWEGKNPGTYSPVQTKLYRYTDIISVLGSTGESLDSTMAKIAQNPETGYELRMDGVSDDFKENIIELARLDHKMATKYLDWLKGMPSTSKPDYYRQPDVNDQLLFQHEIKINTLRETVKEIDMDIIKHRKFLEDGRDKFMREKNTARKDVLRAQHQLNAAAHENLIQIRNDIEEMRLDGIADKEKYANKMAKKRRAAVRQRLKNIVGMD